MAQAVKFAAPRWAGFAALLVVGGAAVCLTGSNDSTTAATPSQQASCSLHPQRWPQLPLVIAADEWLLPARAGVVPPTWMPQHLTPGLPGRPFGLSRDGRPPARVVCGDDPSAVPGRSPAPGSPLVRNYLDI